MRLIVVAVVLSISVASCSSVSNFEKSRAVTSNNLLPGTRARGSADAILGAIGRKRAESGERQAFFERVTLPSWTQLEVHGAGAVERDASAIRELEKLGLSVPARGALEANAKIDNSNKYRLVLLQILDGQRVAQELRTLADSDGELRWLLTQPDLRIVTSVEEVFDHATTAKFNVGGGFNATAVKVGANDLAITAKGSSATTDTLKISDGTVVAYRIARLCWTPDATALTFVTDIGGRDGCPAGTVESPTFSAAVPLPPAIAIQHINWALANAGPTDCEWRYRTIAPECLQPGTNRRCAMEKAVRMAKSGDCDAAYELALMTQCHAQGPSEDIVRSGRQAICNYLKTK